LTLSGGVIRYQPTSASGAAWRGFMDRDSLILVLVPRGSSLSSRRASFLRSAFSVPSRIDRFEGVDQAGDWGEDRSSTTAFGSRDLEPSLPLTRNGNDTSKAHRHIIAVCRPHRAGTTDRESLRRCLRPIRHYVRGRASTPTRLIVRARDCGRKILMRFGRTAPPRAPIDSRATQTSYPRVERGFF
jgi:hypothetical protein